MAPGYVKTDLGLDSVGQLAFRQREIRIMVAGRDVAEEKHHPDLCQVVMLVCMIRTCLPITFRANSCPREHSSWPMASSSNPKT